MKDVIVNAGMHDLHNWKRNYNIIEAHLAMMRKLKGQEGRSGYWGWKVGEETWKREVETHWREIEVGKGMHGW